MIKPINCPVPLNQQPVEEYTELSNSWFFSLSTGSNKNFYKSLLISWFIALPIFILIDNGSIELKNNLVELVILSLTLSLILPLLVILRHWLSWNYILNRLLSENIEYEETGWYDGQIWKKPIDWKERDLLIAQYEVKPTIIIIRRSFMVIILLILFGILNYQTVKTIIHT